MTMETNAIHNFYKNEYKEFLDNLSDSGETNMLGAGIYLIEEFGMKKREAKKIVVWYLTLLAKHNEEIINNGKNDYLLMGE
jgi:hypothetical protein